MRTDVRLWLDDLRNPEDQYIQSRYNAEPSMVWVKTAADAIQLLETGKVTFISLDHDLGAAINGSGYDVAKWIEQAAYEKRIPALGYRIHTDNIIGRRDIAAAMSNAERFWNHERSRPTS